MKRFILYPSWLLACACLLASCLSNDDDDVVYYDDNAITAFSLGTLDTYLHTTSSTGEDSIYKGTVAGSDYKFYINQKTNEIYNPDSLPAGTSLSKVTVTVTTKNGAVALLKSLTSDTLNTFSTTDSLDFTKPRTLVVYSNDGNHYRNYTVSVNCHRQEADVTQWQQTATLGDLVGANRLKLLATGHTLMLLAAHDSHTSIYTSPLADGQTWTLTTPNFNGMLTEDAVAGAVVKQGWAYVLSNGQLLRTQDGQTWQPVDGDLADVSRLMAAHGETLFAVNTAGQIIASADEARTWTAEAADEDLQWLPDTDVSHAAIASKTNADTYSLVVAGNRDAHLWPAEQTAVVWRRLIEPDADRRQNGWMFFNLSEDNHYPLPRLSGLTIMAYDGGLMAMGGQPLGTCSEPPLTNIYLSRDGGITWPASTTLTLPTSLAGSDKAFAATTDADNFIWIVSADGGQVWRGRLNRLGWADNPKSFRE